MSLPNLISLARLLSVPLAVWLILVDQWLPAFAVFLAAGLSDAVDGYIAKRYDAATELGRYMDPLADKALLVGIYITLGLEGQLPAWLVILVVFRDLLIVGGAVLLQLLRYSNKLEPLRISKANTAAQITLAAVVLGQLAFALNLGPLAEMLFFVVAVTTVASGASYLIEWGRRAAKLESSG